MMTTTTATAAQLENHIEPMFVTTTGHLPEAQYKELTAESRLSREEGDILFIGSKTSEGESYNTQELRAIHPNVGKLIDIARSAGCVWILFDADGDEVEGVEVYDR